jgi:pyridinium-3,5-biscarboxylic acid mononucleotide synthase
MESKQIRSLLEKIHTGEVDIETAMEQLQRLPYEMVDNFARLDHHRALRRGFPEVILAEGKTPDQVAQIFNRLAERSTRVLATRVSAVMYAEIRDHIPEATYNSLGRVLFIDHADPTERPEGVLVVSGGTADLPVAEEAVETASLIGNKVERIYDVGVAGLHRLLDQLPKLQRARVIVAVAGMEGALPSVIAGLVSAPVIAVPTSVGYGASFKGVAALLAMLNSCANGVAVVNIDNGFGAGYLAGMINLMGKVGA